MIDLSQSMVFGQMIFQMHITKNNKLQIKQHDAVDCLTNTCDTDTIEYQAASTSRRFSTNIYLECTAAK